MDSSIVKEVNRDQAPLLVSSTHPMTSSHPLTPPFNVNNLPNDVREKLAELELELSEGTLTLHFQPFSPVSRFNYSFSPRSLCFFSLSSCGFTFCSSFIFYLIISGCYSFLSSVEKEQPWKLLVASFEWNPSFFSLCGFWNSGGRWREESPQRREKKIEKKEKEREPFVSGSWNLLKRRESTANYFPSN